MIPRLLAISTALALSLLLLALAVPASVAELHKLVARQPLGIIRSGAYPTEAGFARLITSYRAAIGWNDSPASRVDLAIAYLAQGFVAMDEGRDAALDLDAAQAQLHGALALAPGNHVAWYLLCQVALMRNDTEAAANALTRSYRVVPLDQDNAVTRLSLALQMLGEVDVLTIGLIATETAVMAGRDLRGLAAMATRIGRQEQVVALLETAGVDAGIIDAYVERAREILRGERS